MTVTAPFPTDQSDAIRFLESGAGRAAKTKRIDTHGAIVFLIGTQALKIKRAVKYDYMDLSTVEKRHALLVREFELNHTAAPSIYRVVSAVVRAADGTLSLGIDGEVLEWVLVMDRFAEEAELTHIAQERGIDDDLAQALGGSLAQYHAAAPVKEDDGAALIHEIIDELDRVFATMGAIFGEAAGRFITDARRMYATCAADLSQRSRDRHVRRCHGDLHLRNIVMIDNVPTPFDALEFDERLGTCDTLYDLAFMLMDLDHLCLHHASNLVLNAYLARSKTGLRDSGLSLLPLYLALRAAIRAMVDAQTAAVTDDRDGLENEARAYLAQAHAYLDPAAPRLVAIGGFSGTGKTTIARAVAHLVGAAPGAIHLRSDVMRKTLLERDPLERLGAEGYTAQVTDQTYAMIRTEAAEALAQGQSVFLDAVHGDRALRKAAEDVAKSAGCGFVGIWLTSPTHTRLTRVAQRHADASDADAQVVKRQAAADPGYLSWHIIDTDQSWVAVVSAVTHALVSRPAPKARIRNDAHVG